MDFYQDVEKQIEMHFCMKNGTGIGGWFTSTDVAKAIVSEYTSQRVTREITKVLKANDVQSKRSNGRTIYYLKRVR